MATAGGRGGGVRGRTLFLDGDNCAAFRFRRRKRKKEKRVTGFFFFFFSFFLFIFYRVPRWRHERRRRDTCCCFQCAGFIWFSFSNFFYVFFGRLNRVLNGRFLLVSFLFVGGFTGFFTPVASVLGLIPRLSIKEAMAYRVSRALPLEKPSHLLLPSPGRGPCPPPYRVRIGKTR